MPKEEKRRGREEKRDILEEGKNFQLKIKETTSKENPNPANCPVSSLGF